MAEVILSGPLFDGRAPATAARYVASLQVVLADEAQNRIHARLGEVLQHPTGYYESQIHAEQATTDRVVTDTPVIYGPWLEGTGSRNQTTRFKGYGTFRKVTQKLDQDAAGIAEAELVRGRYLEAMNA